MLVYGLKNYGKTADLTNAVQEDGYLHHLKDLAVHEVLYPSTFIESLVEGKNVKQSLFQNLEGIHKVCRTAAGVKGSKSTTHTSVTWTWDETVPFLVLTLKRRQHKKQEVA